MKNRSAKAFPLIRASHRADERYPLQSCCSALTGRLLWLALAAVAAMLWVPASMAVAQQAAPRHQDGVTIHGTVSDSQGKPVADALVRLERRGAPNATERRSNEEGGFVFSSLSTGDYLLSAEKAGMHSRPVSVSAPSAGSQQQVNLTLESSGESAAASGVGHSAVSSSPAPPAMEFADKPSFTVAGVTDWTAVGGHGSDSTLRTSESLARETLTLKPEGTRPEAASDNSAGPPKSHGSVAADEHRRAGEQNEQRGDPLSAVHEFEWAARLDPSEQNYFAWGSELLLHRAVWQALEVFEKGAHAYPKSARMLTALGTALFAGARYEEAALRLCDASDLNPANPEPYIFMGKVEMAAPNPLPCVAPKLERFVQEHSDRSLANYLYAMALLKRQPQAPDPAAAQQVEALLAKAVAIDPKCADAYLQLGILNSSQHQVEKAIAFYLQAIDANPRLAEAHYRLAVAYDRTGDHARAAREFELHDRMKKAEADAIESQRREIKQFLVDAPVQQAHP